MGNYRREFYDAMMSFKKLKLSGVLSGITPMEHHALKAISVCAERNENVKVSQVVTEMEIPAPGVSRLIGHMEDKGLVRRTVDTADRRSTFVAMTEKGEKLFAECERNLAELGNRIFERMGDERSSELIKNLNLFIAYTDEEMKKMKEEIEERG